MKQIKSLFLGPKAENQELYESIIDEIIKDSCFLRKNFHPSDSPAITEIDKISYDYQLTTAELKQELQSILAELKRGVPLYHPRYIGHMHGDLLISAIAAYFGTMIYNSNNIVGESSPATTRMEFEYISSLAQMVGYKPMNNADNNERQSWGHLSAGGTTANMEALWVARNMKYYPIAVKIASILEENCKFIQDLHVNFFDKMIKELPYSELFNLPPMEILQLKEFIYTRCNDEDVKLDVKYVKDIIGSFEVTKLGIHGIHEKVNELTAAKDNLKLPKLYFAKSYHYSWEKAIDLIGIGHNQIVEVPLDRGFRMDFSKFNEIYDKTSPTLAVIGILGSSKQGSIDPIDDLIQFRENMEQSEKHSFYLHIDGAYGGYFPCILKDDKNNLISTADLIKSLGISNHNEKLPFEINEKWYKKVVAIKSSDSITIDPHKMGYIPYPAGSIIFSDTRCKDFISYVPSYLNKPTDSKDISEEFIGQWTLEGSRPGAAAAACYLSARVLPYHKDAHGIIVKNTIQAAMLFWKSMFRFNNNSELNQGFKVVPAFIPETNIVSYVLSFPEIIKKIEHLNLLTEKLYHRFSVKGDSIIPSINYMVAKEDFKLEDIKHTEIIRECEIDQPADRKAEIKLLSSVFMNPMSVFILEKNDSFYLDFWKEMLIHAKKILSEIMMQIVYEKFNGRKIKILWVEDDDQIEELNRILQYESNISQYVFVDFKTNFQEIQKALTNEYDAYILDLNLKDKNHEHYDYMKIEKTIEIIKKLGVNNHEKILIYSKFFDSEDQKEKVLNDLKPVINIQDFQIISKNNYLKDLTKIVEGIFRIAQSKNT